VRARATVAIAAVIAVLALVAACSNQPPIEPFALEGKRLTVNNLSKDAWQDVEININRQYRVRVPEIAAGQRFDVTLDAFLDVYGNHFYYQRQQIRDVHLTAKVPGGAPVDTHMDFQRTGLNGLADAMKKKEKS
jgi:hypothetical protein